MYTLVGDFGHSIGHFGRNYWGMDFDICFEHNLDSMNNHCLLCIRGDNQNEDLRNIQANIDKNQFHYVQCN